MAKLSLLLSVVGAAWLLPEVDSSVLNSLKKKVFDRSSKEEEQSASSKQAGTSNPHIDEFLTWFKAKGGTVSPSVTLASFPGFGNGLSTTSNGTVSIMDDLFTTPSNIILTKASIASMYGKHRLVIIVSSSNTTFQILPRWSFLCRRRRKKTHFFIYLFIYIHILLLLLLLQLSLSLL